ncbi:MAG: acetamidase/formamidase family protein [bacterium]|nr:acetamidase/formamidase family protein [bacterium]
MSQTFTIPKHHRHPAFDPTIPPVFEITPGDTVTFATDDAPFERLFSGESIEAIGMETFNAVTGPVAVLGAKPGDALRIEILDISLTRAWSVWLPGYGGFGHQTDRLQVQPIALNNGRAHISERLTVPLDPMIGCIGLAPERGRSSTLAPAYPWGGNMDLRELSPGATLYLPVQVPGALLSLGDLHAAMGTGEPACVSLEAVGEATLKIDLEKNTTLQFPMLRLEGHTLCVGMGRSIHEAQGIALDHAYNILLKVHDLTPREAYAYACARVSLRFAGPASPTVLAVVPDPDIQ